MKVLRWLNPSTSEFIYTVLLKPRWLRALAQYVIKKLIPSSMMIEGVRLVLNQEDAVLCGALALGCYERFELRVFKGILRPGMLILDVGANIGLFSAVAASVLGVTGRIIAVEPDARNCEFIRRTIQEKENSLTNLTVVQRAVSNMTGTGQLYLCPDNKADHRIYDKGARNRRQVFQ